MAQPRLTVTAPTAVPLGYGLLPAAGEQLRPDAHARLGTQYEPVTGNTAGVSQITDPLSGAFTGPLVAEDYAAYPDGAPLVTTSPFLCWAGIKAKPVGTTVEELMARARAKLQLTAGWCIERGFYPQLTAAASTTLAGAPVDPDIAIGLIEQWLADKVGAQGVIHAPRLAIGSIGKHTSASGNRQVTKLGCPVAYGGGYQNLAPGGGAAAAGTVWVYATGPVLVNRSGIDSQPGTGPAGVDYPSNTATVFATEVVSVGYEVGVVAVPVKFEVENP